MKSFVISLEFISSCILGITLHLLSINGKNSLIITIILLSVIFLLSFHAISAILFSRNKSSTKTKIFKSILAFSIILTLVLFGYWLIGNPFKKNILKVSLYSGFSDYLPGIQVHEIKWEKGYREYILEFSNENENYEISDLRANIDFPWVIVHYEIEQNHGTQDLRISQQINAGGIASRGNNAVIKTFDYYTNSLDVDAVKIFPKGNISIKLIARTNSEDIYGTIISHYKYLNSLNQTMKESPAFFIKHRNNKYDLYIDNENLILSHEIQCYRLIEPKQGIIWFNPDGSITYNKNPEETSKNHQKHVRKF